MKAATSCLGVLLFVVGCAGFAKDASSRPSAEEKIERIKIGDLRKQVIEVWGKSEVGVERYPSAAYDVLTYLDKDGHPEVFFTVDPKTEKVAAKSLWVRSDSPLYDLKAALKTRLHGEEWKTYSPCRTKSRDDKF